MTEVTDKQVLAQGLDREMLGRPHLWPYEVGGHKCIFVKRWTPENGLYTGPCYLLEDGTHLVISHDWSGKASEEPKTEKLSFASAQEVYDAGWRVD